MDEELKAAAEKNSDAATLLSRGTIVKAMEAGRLLAHSQADILVENHSLFSLEITDVSINRTQRVVTKGQSVVTLEPGTTYFNNDALGTPGIAGSSVIHIEQDAYPRSYYGDDGSLGTLTFPDGPQNLYVRGQIENSSGEVRLTNYDGSVSVTGTIRGARLNISAAGDFNLSSDNWYHAGADPRQYLQFIGLFGKDVITADGRTKLETYGGMEYGWIDPRIDQLLGAINDPARTGSMLFAMGAIDINARYLNLDGTIQSGIDRIDLSIDENFAPETSSQFFDNEGRLLSGLAISSEHRSALNGYVDTENKIITLDDIEPAGGVVNLTGTIINTGSGAIRVASGFASVNIQNKSSYTLATGVIDASTNRTGMVTITDAATLKREVFTFKDGGYTQENFVGTLKVTDGLGSIAYDSTGQITGDQANLVAPLVYQPEPGRFYVWTEGVAKTKTKYEV
jgi:hypothetical protein